MEDETKQVVMKPDELCDLMKRAVNEALTKFGVDTSHPLDVQRDLQFLRDWRTTTESVRGKAVLAAVGFVYLKGKPVYNVESARRTAYCPGAIRERILVTGDSEKSRGDSDGRHDREPNPGLCAL
jgi:hypothetical protein